MEIKNKNQFKEFEKKSCVNRKLAQYVFFLFFFNNAYLPLQICNFSAIDEFFEQYDNRINVSIV